MGSAGYDIGAGLSSSSGAGANLNSPFNVTGGGGSGGNQASGSAPVSGGPSGNWITYLPLIVIGVALLGVVGLLFTRN